MLLLDNIRFFRTRATEVYSTEYEVTADANVVGVMAYDGYLFKIWEIGEKPKGAIRRLCLRIDEKASSEDEEHEPGSAGTRLPWSPPIAEEFIPIASLLLRRRFTLGPVVRYHDVPWMFRFGRSSRSGFIDEALVRGETNLEEMSEWLALLEGLDVGKQDTFVLAAKFYHEALQLIEQKPDLAYLNLVSAIEILCQDVDVGPVAVREIDQGLANMIAHIPDEDLRREIEEALVRRQPFVQRKFVRFIEQYTRSSFWDDPARPSRGRIDPSQFRELLTRVYAQRSSTLHRGEPFPTYVFWPPLSKEEEIPNYALAFHSDNGATTWEPKDYIPYPHFFEKLVNHVLKEYLKAHQVTTISEYVVS